jgi:hypothetical protein
VNRNQIEHPLTAAISPFGRRLGGGLISIPKPILSPKR